MVAYIGARVGWLGKKVVALGGRYREMYQCYKSGLGCAHNPLVGPIDPQIGCKKEHILLITGNGVWE